MFLVLPFSSPDHPITRSLMNLHKLYLSVFALLCVLALIAGSAWRDHVRDDARRDAVIETQKSEIAQVEQRIAAAQNDAASRIADLERERKELLTQPGRAPQVIRELVPMQAPIQSSGNPAKAPPDAPSATLTRDQQVDLAQYALGCKECSMNAISFSSKRKISRRSSRGRRSSLMLRRNPRRVEVCGNARNELPNGERSLGQQVT